MKQKEGSVLVLVMMISVLVGILGMAGFYLARLDARETRKLIQKETALNMAEAGSARLKAITSLKENYETFETLGLIDNSGNAVLSETLTDESGTAIGSYQIYIATAASSDPDYSDYSVRIVGTSASGEQTATIRTNARMEGISGNVYGSRTEGRTDQIIRFTTGDVLEKVRTNDSFYIDGTPTFLEKVKTSASYYYNNDGSSYETTTANNTAVFKDGISFGAAELPFEDTLITDISSLAAESVSGDCSITFDDEIPGLGSEGYYLMSQTTSSTNTIDVTYSTTTYYWTRTYSGKGKNKKTVTETGTSTSEADVPRDATVTSTSTKTDTRTEDQITYSTITTTNTISSLGDTSDSEDNIIYVDGTVTVHGEVSGTMTIACNGTIEIDDNLTYASAESDSDPANWTSEPDAGDILGLFATEKVILTDHNYNTDRNIHASIYVTNDSDDTWMRGFCVENHTTSDINKPYINLYGSIIQCARGAVGAGDSGYKKNYRQDKKLRQNPAPGTPFGSPGFYDWQVTYND